MNTMDKMLMEQIKELLDTQGMTYQEADEGILVAPFKEYSFMYHVCEDRLDFRARINTEVPEKLWGEMRFFLGMVNTIIAEGHWELVDEYVYYRLYTDRSINKEVQESRLLGLLQRGCKAVELLQNAVEVVCDGTLDGMDAFLEMVMPQTEEADE